MPCKVPKKLYHCSAHLSTGDRVWTGNYCFIIQHFFPFVQWFFVVRPASIHKLEYFLISGQGPACLLSFFPNVGAALGGNPLHSRPSLCYNNPRAIIREKLFRRKAEPGFSSLCKCHARKDCKVILGADFCVARIAGNADAAPPDRGVPEAARKNLDPGGPTLERDSFV